MNEEIKVNDKLNPTLWNDQKELLPEVREKLQSIVDKFIENLKEDEIDIKPIDICIIGSNANFNYTKSSDIDLHIIADLSIIDSHKDLLLATYQAYKKLFNDKYDITIKGQEVEIYVEDGKVNANTNGIFSFNDGWIKEPKKEVIPKLDVKLFNQKFSQVEDEYKSIIIEPTIERVDKFIDHLYLLRQQGITKDGEFAIENLLFKEARNLGYLQNLKDKKVELETKELSLEQLKEESTSKNAQFEIDATKYLNEKYSSKYPVLFKRTGKSKFLSDIAVIKKEDEHKWENCHSSNDYRELALFFIEAKMPKAQGGQILVPMSEEDGIKHFNYVERIQDSEAAKLIVDYLNQNPAFQKLRRGSGNNAEMTKAFFSGSKEEVEHRVNLWVDWFNFLYGEEHKNAPFIISQGKRDDGTKDFIIMNTKDIKQSFWLKPTFRHKGYRADGSDAPPVVIFELVLRDDAINSEKFESILQNIK